ncbi:PREDICTED: KH domain-containing, RNA-binding, signal transduction-associated protein 2-like isoform X2 [Ceratosolen solmsi marchali]|uniref:KH domain-containing, RNA-binding, signal transduction-associated protein 2-like isoform X2 n=1 Tax=Ceratosolen solmsi marchali TaxID=326594 RepID=A0AAJ7DT64_9HYME|nr:PREDICTED: KH domain-containing, RNA-binding, signal transduction-associated protein 2-like isoform X2 [Ceratosolen solmsi marchali]
MADRSSNGIIKQEVDNRSSAEKDEEKQQTDKANEYVRELMLEKLEVNTQKTPNAARLLDQEIQKTQTSGKPSKDQKYVDIYREKPIRVSVKVLVPIREHPKGIHQGWWHIYYSVSVETTWMAIYGYFENELIPLGPFQFNFVGKLLGPKGNSMKRLQEETMCKMAVLGRGSMKDRQKEDELRKSLDPKYSHLSDDLHVEITALAPPAEAHARIAFALAEVRKYLIPDNNDNIRQEQMREMELTVDEPVDDRRPSNRGGILRPVVRPGPPGPPGMRGVARPILPPPPPTRGPITRPVPAKTKVFSILDRARVAMDQSYGYDSAPPTTSRASHHDYDYHGSSSSSRYISNERHYSSSVNDDMYPLPPSSRYGGGGATYDYDDESGPHGSSHDYYDAPDYPVQRSMKFGEDSSSRAWKSYKTTTTGTGGSGASARYRATPYSRPSK